MCFGKGHEQGTVCVNFIQQNKLCHLSFPFSHLNLIHITKTAGQLQTCTKDMSIWYIEKDFSALLNDFLHIYLVWCIYFSSRSSTKSIPVCQTLSLYLFFFLDAYILIDKITEKIEGWKFVICIYYIAN